jgi:hypothetical protein
MIAGSVGTVRILDNGDAGFSTVGHWSPFTGDGFQNDMHFAGAGGGAQEAHWSFAVSPGQYRISATWSAHANRATDAPFTVFNGSNPFPTVVINQEQAPNDLVDAGANWEFLGGILNITAGTLVVRLTDLANEYVIADAIRVERVGDLPPQTPDAPSLASMSAPSSDTLDGNTMIVVTGDALPSAERATPAMTFASPALAASPNFPAADRELIHAAALSEIDGKHNSHRELSSLSTPPSTDLESWTLPTTEDQWAETPLLDDHLALLSALPDKTVHILALTDASEQLTDLAKGSPDLSQQAVSAQLVDQLFSEHEAA